MPGCPGACRVLGQLGQPERVITVAMMIKQVPDTFGQKRQITSVWLGLKASFLMTHLTLHDYRRDDSAAGSELALSVSGIGWLTTRLHKLRADTGEVRVALRKSAAALKTECCPAFEMAGWPAYYFHAGIWFQPSLDDGWCAGEILA